jgi:hypothetical protein
MPEKAVVLDHHEAQKESARELRHLLVLGLFSAWVGFVLLRFFDEHPLDFSLFFRLLGQFHIPLQVQLEKLGLMAKHLGLAALSAGTGMLAGRLLLRMLSIRLSDNPSRCEITQHLMLSLGLGWGLLMYAAFLLGIAGLLTPLAVWLLMLGLLIICLPEARRFSKDVSVLLKREVQEERTPLLLKIGLAGCAVVLISVLLVALAPSITHDAMVYHLNVPRIYADAHKIVPIPYNLFSNTVLNMEMLYALALSIDDFILANLLHFAMGLAALVALYAFARPALGKTVATLAVLILFFNPLVLNEISIAYIDLGMMFYFLLMMACLWRWSEKDEFRWFLLFCIFGGLFAGMKYTALHGLIAAGAALAVIELGRKRSVRGFLTKSVLFGAVAAAFVLPYLVKNYLFSGNPFYPLMYGLFGGRWLAPAQVERMLAYVNSHGMGHDWKHLVMLPWNITVLGNSGFKNFDAVITPLWLAFLPAFFLVRRKPAILKWTVFLCTVYFLSWSTSTHITRYLMPLFPLLSLLCAYALIALSENIAAFSKSLRRTMVAAVATVCGIIWFSFSFFYPLRAPSKFGAAVWGEQTRDAFLEKIVPGYSAFTYINDNLPQDAKLAFFWDNRGFFCEREQIGDSVFEAPSMLQLVHEAGSARAFHKKIRSMGINYILFNDLFSEKFPPFPVSLADGDRLAEDMRILKKFLKGYCYPFFKADGITLYAVHK